jgi:hypothetical protein
MSYLILYGITLKNSECELEFDLEKLYRLSTMEFLKICYQHSFLNKDIRRRVQYFLWMLKEKPVINGIIYNTIQLPNEYLFIGSSYKKISLYNSSPYAIWGNNLRLNIDIPSDNITKIYINNRFHKYKQLQCAIPNNIYPDDCICGYVMYGYGYKSNYLRFHKDDKKFIVNEIELLNTHLHYNFYLGCDEMCHKPKPRKYNKFIGIVLGKITKTEYEQNAIVLNKTYNRDAFKLPKFEDIQNTMINDILDNDISQYSQKEIDNILILERTNPILSFIHVYTCCCK